MKWNGGEHGLEVKCAWVIWSYLQMVHKGTKGINMSEIAAQSFNFVKVHGRCVIRQWANKWIENEDLPASQCGCHVKVLSLLDNPEIAMEIQSYLCLHKWAKNAQKLQEFVNKMMLPAEADKYVKEIDKEMSKGMKYYLELELFPHIHLKIGKWISLTAVHNWMHCNGFQYQIYKEGVYFDGHKHSDVVEYKQNGFLPTMAHHCLQLVDMNLGISARKSRRCYLLGQRSLCFLLMMNPQCRLMTERGQDGDQKESSQY